MWEPGGTGPSSKVDVDGALFHSFPGPRGEMKEHLLCSCRRVPVPLHDNNLTLPRHLGCLFTTNDRRHHRRTSGTPSTITQVRSTARRTQQGYIQNTSSLSFSPFHPHTSPLYATTTTTISRCGSKSKISSAFALVSATPSSSLPVLATPPDLLFAAHPSIESNPPPRCGIQTT
jgi:hypothetical protein